MRIYVHGFFLFFQDDFNLFITAAWDVSIFLFMVKRTSVQFNEVFFTHENIKKCYVFFNIYYVLTREVLNYFISANLKQFANVSFLPTSSNNQLQYTSKFWNLGKCQVSKGHQNGLKNNIIVL